MVQTNVEKCLPEMFSDIHCYKIDITTKKPNWSYKEEELGQFSLCELQLLTRFKSSLLAAMTWTESPRRVIALVDLETGETHRRFDTIRVALLRDDLLHWRMIWLRWPAEDTLVLAMAGEDSMENVAADATLEYILVDQGPGRLCKVKHRVDFGAVRAANGEPLVEDPLFWQANKEKETISLFKIEAESKARKE